MNINPEYFAKSFIFRNSMQINSHFKSLSHAKQQGMWSGVQPLTGIDWIYVFWIAVIKHQFD